MNVSCSSFFGVKPDHPTPFVGFAFGEQRHSVQTFLAPGCSFVQRSDVLAAYLECQMRDNSLNVLHDRAPEPIVRVGGIDVIVVWLGAGSRYGRYPRDLVSNAAGPAGINVKVVHQPAFRYLTDFGHMPLVNTLLKTMSSQLYCT